MTEFVMPETHYALSGDVKYRLSRIGEWPGRHHDGPVICFTLNFVTNCPAIPLLCVAFRASRVC